MAQWYTHLVFKGDTFIGDSLTDWQKVDGIAKPDLNHVDRFTAVVVSGYALYGQLQGYYALGVAHVLVDPSSGKAHYLSEQSALHREPVDTLTSVQKEAVRKWLIHHYPFAWENSTDAFKKILETERG